MGAYNVHAGHCPQGHGAYGAVGILQESVENRRVKNKLIELLRNEGQTVYDCTDDTNCDVNTNLVRIVEKCNQHAVDYDVSLHLNSGRGDYSGDGNTGGVEVWCYDEDTAEVAERICKEISSRLGIYNRGVKFSKDLYVLNNTISQAFLVECCFVDDADDAEFWNAEECAVAIASGILNRNIEEDSVEGFDIINATVQSNSGADFMRLLFEPVDADNKIYRIKDKEHGYFMTAAANKANANVDFRGFDCGDYQKWKVVYKQYKLSRYMMFECVATPGLYLSVENNGIGKNNLKLYSDLRNSKQKFFFRDEKDNTYIVMHAFSGKSISAKE